MSDANLLLRLVSIICLFVASGLSVLWGLAQGWAIFFCSWATALALATAWRLRRKVQ